nr:PilZ domain-containing protein [Petropleomorpha daqingensis]
MADLPGIGSVLDLVPSSRSGTFMSWMDDLADGDLIVSTPCDQARRPISLPVGERLEVVWADAGGLHAVPAELAGTLIGEMPRWRLRVVGVAKRGQRRDAVRAPLIVPVELGLAIHPVLGRTIDLSEGGLRCVLDRTAHFGLQLPAVGDVVRVVVDLPELPLRCRSEITRLHPRSDARVELSLRFIGLTEQDQDDVRRQVFARLRELRQRGLL